MMSAAQRINAELLVIAERLAAEYDDIPTGSVLRCLSRAVRQAMRSGCAVELVPEVAEAKAREALAQRRRPQVPRPREQGDS